MQIHSRVQTLIYDVIPGEILQTNFPPGLSFMLSTEPHPAFSLVSVALSSNE